MAAAVGKLETYLHTNIVIPIHLSGIIFVLESVIVPWLAFVRNWIRSAPHCAVSLSPLHISLIPIFLPSSSFQHLYINIYMCSKLSSSPTSFQIKISRSNSTIGIIRELCITWSTCSLVMWLDSLLVMLIFRGQHQITHNSPTTPTEHSWRTLIINSLVFANKFEQQLINEQRGRQSYLTLLFR